MTDGFTDQAEEGIGEELAMPHNKKDDEASNLGEEEIVAPSVEAKVAEELAETKDRLLRLAADFENFKKIAAREQQNVMKFANENLILQILPIKDSLEQAVIAGKKSGDNDVVVGIDMVLKQLNDMMVKAGVEIISAHGQPFDPSRHEAMGYQEDDSVDENIVVQEYQKGYLLNGRLLRPARVVLAKRSGS